MKALALAPAESIHASNLAFALRSLPRERREAAFVFYRFCRAVDDLADEEWLPVDERRVALEGWKHALLTGHGLPAELEAVVRTYGLDTTCLTAVVRGCLDDLEPTRFATLTELRAYCWNVACAVGLASIRIFGCGDAAKKYALHLGYALQFTNILRDVREDAERHRLYLPNDFFCEPPASATALLRDPPPPGLGAALQKLTALAEEEFAAARAALPPEDARALLPARIMAALYGHLLRAIKKNPLAVLKVRPTLSKSTRFLLVLRTLLGRI